MTKDVIILKKYFDSIGVKYVMLKFYQNKFRYSQKFYVDKNLPLQ